MASEEHKTLASRIKRIHRELRKLSVDVGPDAAWEYHMKDEKTLEIYAKSMKELAEKHWKIKATSGQDRIEWTVIFCESYFTHTVMERWRQKDLRAISILTESEADPAAYPLLDLPEKLEVLDVGSSGNFFRSFKNLNILPIDISPSDKSVFTCDFLTVPVAGSLKASNKNVQALPSNHFHVVIFCLLLEYLPSSVQRIKCCEKAYEVLKTEGVLVIITPDSSHEMKNSRQIKNWRWTLSKLGFHRVKLAKLKNLTCMAFRKSLTPEIPMSWADSHQEPYMDFKLEIPQDKLLEELMLEGEGVDFDAEVMNELPQV